MNYIPPFKATRTLLKSAIPVLFIFFFMGACASARRLALRERTAREAIQTARAFLGTPYRWGGTTRTGIDCSGLLVNTFDAVDIPLPRTSAAQAKMGKKVRLHRLKPGDLVFFATGKKRNTVTHAGVVTLVKKKKDIRFIHASSSLGVEETNLYGSYYRKRFRRGRRVIR